MKYLFAFPLFCTMALIAGCGPADTGAKKNAALADTAGYTRILWLDSMVNFGTIRKGEKIKVAFRFRNTGNRPLVLASVRAGCGCTIPEYTKEPVPPGSEGVVTGAFDSDKAGTGEVRKSIFVTANTQNKTIHTLIFTGLISKERNH